MGIPKRIKLTGGQLCKTTLSNKISNQICKNHRYGKEEQNQKDFAWLISSHERGRNNWVRLEDDFMNNNLSKDS